MLEYLCDSLQGLVDGSRPLPPPHPQRLSFTNDVDAIYAVALATDQLLFRRRAAPLAIDDLPHLLFKLASWCRRDGATSHDEVRLALGDVMLPVDMALSCHPTWLKSRAGVSWTIRRYEQWKNEAKNFARLNYVTPPRVAELDFMQGYYLAELTNSAHVHQEGIALNHCMSWSLNPDSMKKYALNGPKSLDCLTYAVKLRAGDLRLFSVRNPSGKPVITISYAPKKQKIMHIQGGHGPARDQWSPLRCSAVRAIATHAPVRRIDMEFTCERCCRHRSWCTTELEHQPEHSYVFLPRR